MDINKNFDSELFNMYVKKIRTETDLIKKENLLKSVRSWLDWLKDKNKITPRMYENLITDLKKLGRITSYTKNDLDKNNKNSVTKYSIIYIVSFLFISSFIFNFYLYNNFLSLKSEMNVENDKGRVLPFKGTIKQTDGQPLDTKRDSIFNLYTSASGGSPVYIGSCLGEDGIEPTHNGSFSILIGSDCGMKPIPESLFKNNLSLYLGVVIGKEPEFAPRHQIITSTFSKDTNKLQGMTLGSDLSSIPFINDEGTIDITNESPTVNSTNGLFTLQGSAITIRSTKEGGNIIFDTAIGSDIIIPTGKLGIGTFSPQTVLDVSSNSILTSVASISNLTREDTPDVSILDLSLGSPVNGTNANYIEFFAGKDSINPGIKVGGIGLNNGGVVYETSGADFAEYFEVADPKQFRLFQLVSLNSTGVNPARTGEKIIGVISNTAGYIGNYKYNDQNTILVGLVGQVEVLVTDSNGEIKRGDVVGASDIPGYGAKLLDGNSRVGYAIENPQKLTNISCESSLKSKLNRNGIPISCGKVKIIINLD